MFYYIFQIFEVLCNLSDFIIHSVPEILLASGIPEDIARSSIRLSVGRETTRKDIDDAVEDLKEAVAVAKSKKTD